MEASNKGTSGSLTHINKLNPFAPEFYPVAYSIRSSYPFYVASQFPWNSPTIAPAHPTGSSPQGNQRKLVAFNMDATISNNLLRGIFQQYGAVEKVENSPNDRRIRFITFFDAGDANRALAALEGQRVGSISLKIERSHWRTSPNPTPTYRPNNIPPRLQKQGLKDAAQRLQRKSIGRGGVAGKDGWISDAALVINGGDKGLYEKSHQPEESNKARSTSQESSEFVFDEKLAKANSQHARTTIMIRNIPNGYSQDRLLKVLDSHCKRCNERSRDAEEPISEYDFVYLPIDFKAKLNLGYAFVNFTSAKATWKLYKALHMQHWESLKSKNLSRKICEIAYAKIQGRAALESHFRNSNIRCDNDKYLPLVFEPPRNGKESKENPSKFRVISHEV